ncbi:hypothetical protein AC244_32590 [Ensifer adhaerens]|uniref:Uncharacterized protein n=2 Tax=Ensifer adhaerens TaxID=106592 RepID=A0A0L8BED0_ENSAD|nr:hypothetical protein AC244_32590 [Ensifer adhaerens]
MIVFSGGNKKDIYLVMVGVQPGEQARGFTDASTPWNYVMVRPLRASALFSALPAFRSKN